jgi:putative hydrolase of the HAD superfamily
MGQSLSWWIDGYKKNRRQKSEDRSQKPGGGAGHPSYNPLVLTSLWIMITTVIFDLDDTLYDEVDYCRSGFEAVAEFLRTAFQINVPAERVVEILWRQFNAGNRTETFNAALKELDVPFDQPLIASLVRVYRNHVPAIRLPKESRDCLVSLRRSYSMAVLTDGYLPAQRLKIRALGITGYLKCILYTEHLGRSYWKPSPVGFIKVLETLHAQPSQAVYVADNPTKDFIAPNQLGMRSIQVTRPLRLHRNPPPDPSGAAQHTLDSLSQLPALLQGVD